MSRLFFISAAVLIFLGSVAKGQSTKKANKDTKTWNYEIEVVGVGVQGTSLIKVWSYSKNPVIAIEQAKKNAIHGIIFQGYLGKRGIEGRPPLLPDDSVATARSDFFDHFFADDGDYKKYVTLTNDGAVAAEDRLKIGKEYKIGVVVSVNIAELRKRLENEGAIKSISSGF